ncbi:uncharacterized protein LOC122572521 [Bombus pyrosoma]|uniref:uncharacterized protein LOC122572521 n=1 Tax=Bombus pyrosoma TaxID=396416 RepID=UPI001CB8C4F8|nr:uncharacterized protein LOC122572521 [Bombus pyrosoma]
MKVPLFFQNLPSDPTKTPLFLQNVQTLSNLLKILLFLQNASTPNSKYFPRLFVYPLTAIFSYFLNNQRPNENFFILSEAFNATSGIPRASATDKHRDISHTWFHVSMKLHCYKKYV